jgi:hypothetical protein
LSSAREPLSRDVDVKAHDNRNYWCDVRTRADADSTALPAWNELEIHFGSTCSRPTSSARTLLMHMSAASPFWEGCATCMASISDGGRSGAPRCACDLWAPVVAWIRQSTYLETHAKAVFRLSALAKAENVQQSIYMHNQKSDQLLNFHKTRQRCSGQPEEAANGGVHTSQDAVHWSPGRHST